MLLQVYLIILGSINNTEKKNLVEPQDGLYIFDVHICSKCTRLPEFLRLVDTPIAAAILDVNICFFKLTVSLCFVSIHVWFNTPST